MRQRGQQPTADLHGDLSIGNTIEFTLAAERWYSFSFSESVTDFSSNSMHYDLVTLSSRGHYRIVAFAPLRVPSSHLAMLSHPQEVADFVAELLSQSTKRLQLRVSVHSCHPDERSKAYTLDR